MYVFLTSTRYVNCVLFNLETRLLHWSNILGASHSRKYMVWQYGQHASRGVKELCEFAYTRTLEKEIKQHVSFYSEMLVECVLFKA